MVKWEVTNKRIYSNPRRRRDIQSRDHPHSLVIFIYLFDNKLCLESENLSSTESLIFTLFILFNFIKLHDRVEIVWFLSESPLFVWFFFFPPKFVGFNFHRPRLWFICGNMFLSWWIEISFAFNRSSCVVEIKETRVAFRIAEKGQLFLFL